MLNYAKTVHKMKNIRLYVEREIDNTSRMLEFDTHPFESNFMNVVGGLQAAQCE